MIIEPPKTLQNFKEVEKSILELMANPYCHVFIFDAMIYKLKNCRAKIDELRNESK